VRHAHLHVIGELAHQPTRDLLRRPPQLELRFHDRSQPRTRHQLRHPRATRPPQRRSISSTRPIRTPTAVAGDLTRHRRRRSPQSSCDRPQRTTRGQATRDLLTLRRRQPQRRPLPLPWRGPRQRDHRPTDRMTRPPELLTQPPERSTLRQQLRDPLPLLRRQPFHSRPPRTRANQLNDAMTT